MKKLIITIVTFAGIVASIQAQGLVKFQNNNFAKIQTNSVLNGSATGQTGAAAGLFYYALFFSTTATTVNGSALGDIGVKTSADTNSPSANAATYAFQDANWTAASGVIGTNTSTIGRFASTTPNASGDTAISNLGTAVNAQFVILGWSGNIGSTLASVIAWYNNGTPLTAGYIGESAVTGTLKTGDGGSTTTPNLMGNVAGQAPTFTLGLVPVPEPATMALAGLGGLALLAFRRKK